MRFWAVAVAASLVASGAVAKSHKYRKEGEMKIAAAASPRNPNGSWTIEATTRVGDCSALIPTGLTVADNKVASASGASLSAWGYVDEDGNIVARFTGQGEHVVRFHGLVRGGKATGAWSSSTDMCGGAWRGEQQ